MGCAESGRGARSSAQRAARIEGYEKYIYHYGDEPAELYDLREDPCERDDIVDEQSRAKLDLMREEPPGWRLEAAGLYNNADPEGDAESFESS